MESDELTKLVLLREFLVKEYKKLTRNKTQPSSMMTQKDAALILERAIKELDSSLFEHVNFS